VEDEDAAQHLAERAKEVHANAEKYFQGMVIYGPKFPVEVIPPVADDKPGEKPKLHLPMTDFTSERNAGIVRMDLKAIQRQLRKKPFNKANVINAIWLATTSWEREYGALYPDDLCKLDSVLKSLAHRLEGTINPEDYDEHDVALAEKEARPFLKKLEAAYSDVLGQLEAIKGDRLTLEKQRADVEAMQVRLREETEKYMKLADKAKEREAAARLDGEKVGMALEAYDHAVTRSTERVDALRKRREETAAFLGRLDRQRAPFDGENPPEAAIILAYPSAA
jgi:hypothetical protein